MKLYPESAGEKFYDVARDLGRTAAAAKGEARGRYAGRAVAALRRAVAAGFRDAGRAREDDALEVLRKREDFQQLVKEMESKSGPDGK
jgi:hypothetical protein